MAKRNLWLDETSFALALIALTGTQACGDPLKSPQRLDEARQTVSGVEREEVEARSAIMHGEEALTDVDARRREVEVQDKDVDEVVERLRESKMSQLRESLRPTVTVVNQLGIAETEAVEVFRKMLKQNNNDEELDAKSEEEES